LKERNRTSDPILQGGASLRNTCPARKRGGKVKEEKNAIQKKSTSMTRRTDNKKGAKRGGN